MPRDATQLCRENAFKNLFDDLFDIAPVDVMSMIENKDDKQFLSLQREKRRPRSMTSVDMTLHIC